MNLAKKLAKIFSLIFLASFLASCDKGCVAADEFDGKSVTVESNPGANKITGTYNGEYDPINDDVTGGQKIEWTKTGLRSNGEQFLIQVTGEWTPWFGEETTSSQLGDLKACSFCTRKSGADVHRDNCICHQNQISVPEISSDGYTPVTPTPDCSGSDQDDPKKCTCTTGYGVTPPYSATSYTSYHIPLNYEDKFGVVKPANEQEPCKYNGGMGLYIGLFGRSGNDVPIRVYHLFTEEAICDIGLDSDGKCVDENGKDATKYLFRSANKTIFVKDDGQGNNSDKDYYKAGATMHSPNEEVKMIIYDSYYLDNTGSYNTTFFNGIGSAKGVGLLEFLVSLIEDTVMGEESCVEDPDTGEKNCVREGGVIEFMYKAIVTDSDFITALHVLLSLYICFYGVATLIGVADINKKELTSRIIKIGLVILFTSANSWAFYNEIIVGFFKDSMDSVVGMFMDLSDSNLDSQTSSILISQIDRTTDTSNSTRFSFIDLTITKLLSAAAAKKIFGLFFSSIFGLLYILAIYFLIASFIYVMLLAATFYVVNLMKLVVVLSLGPVFMCFSLFSQTNPIFKRWISYLGSRSLEIVIMFIILYNFVVLIDQKFVSLLYYKTCYETWGLPGAKFGIYKSYINRSLVSWCTDFVALGGLIFITKMVIDQIPSVAGYLITIGGDANKDPDNIGRGQSGMGLADRIMGGGKNPSGGAERGVSGFVKIANEKVYDAVKFSAGTVFQGGTQVLRTTGVSGFIDKISDPLPDGLRSRYRNGIIDAAINKAQKEATAKGLTETKADMYIRQQTISAMQTKMHRGENQPGKPKTFDPSGMKIAGVNMKTILARLDNKLVKEPLEAFIIEEAAKQRSSVSPLLGDAFQKELKNKANEWAEKNLSGGKKAVEKYLGKFEKGEFKGGEFKNLIKNQSIMTTSEVAKAFAGDEAGQNRYLQHLKDQESRQNKIGKTAAKFGKPGEAAYKLGKFVSSVVNRNDYNNPTKQREIFLRKVEKNKRKAAAAEKNAKLTRLQYFDPRNISLSDLHDKMTGDLVLGRFFDRSNVDKINKETDERILRDAVSDADKRFKQDKEKTANDYDKRLRELSNKEQSIKLQKDISDKEDSDKIAKELEKRNSSNQNKEFIARSIANQKELEEKMERRNASYEEEVKKLAKEKSLLEAEKKNALEDIEAKERLFNSQKGEFFKDQIKQNSQKEVDAKFKEIEALRSSKNEEDRLKAERMQQELLQKAISDYEKAKKEQVKIKNSVIEVKDAKERAKKLRDLGGEEVVKNGLNQIKVDGRVTTLSEEALRLRFINERIEGGVQAKLEADRRAEESLEKLKLKSERLESQPKNQQNYFGMKYAQNVKAQYNSEVERKLRRDLENNRKEQIAREYQESYDRKRGAEIESEKAERVAKEVQRETKALEDKVNKLQKEALKNAEKIAGFEKVDNEFKTMAVVGNTLQEREKQLAKLKSQEEINKRNLANAQRKAEALKKSIALAQKKAAQIKKRQTLEKDISALSKKIIESEKELTIARSELISATNQRKIELEQQQKDAEEKSIASQKALFQLRKEAELDDNIDLFTEKKINSLREVEDLSLDSAYLEKQQNISDAKIRFRDANEIVDEANYKKSSIVIDGRVSVVKSDIVEINSELGNLKKVIEDNKATGTQTPDSITEAYDKASNRRDAALNLQSKLADLKRAQAAVKYVKINNKKFLAKSEEGVELDEAKIKEEERVVRKLYDAEEMVGKASEKFAVLQKDHIASKISDTREEIKKIQEETVVNATKINDCEERLKIFATAAVIGNTPDERMAHSLELATQEAGIRKELVEAKLVADDLRRKEDLAKAEISYLEAREELKNQSLVNSLDRSKNFEIHLKKLQDEENNVLSNIKVLEKRLEEVNSLPAGNTQEEIDAHLAQKENAGKNLATAKVVAQKINSNVKLATKKIASFKKVSKAEEEVGELSKNLSQSERELSIARTDPDYLSKKQEIQDAKNRAIEAQEAIANAEKEKKRLEAGFDIQEARDGLKKMNLESKTFDKSMEKIALNDAAYDLDIAIATTANLQEEWKVIDEKVFDLWAHRNQVQGERSNIEDIISFRGLDKDKPSQFEIENGIVEYSGMSGDQLIERKKKLINEVAEIQVNLKKANNDKLAIQIEIDEAKKIETIKGAYYNVCKSELNFDEAKESYIKFQNDSHGKYETPEAIMERDNLLQDICEAELQLKYNQYEFLRCQLGVVNHLSKEIDEASKYVDDLESWSNIRDKTEQINIILDEVDEKKSLSDYLKISYDQVSTESKEFDFKIYSLAGDREQSLARSKLAKLDISVRKNELLYLNSKDPSNLSAAEKIRISVLEQEVDRFEQDAKKYESEADEIDGQIGSLGSS